jgi:hypothetical protein
MNQLNDIVLARVAASEKVFKAGYDEGFKAGFTAGIKETKKIVEETFGSLLPKEGACQTCGGRGGVTETGVSYCNCEEVA